MTVTITLLKSHIQLLNDSIENSINEIEKLIDYNNDLITNCNDQLACNDYQDFDTIIETIENSKQQLILLQDMHDKYTSVKSELSQTYNE